MQLLIQKSKNNSRLTPRHFVRDPLSTVRKEGELLSFFTLFAKQIGLISPDYRWDRGDLNSLY